MLRSVQENDSDPQSLANVFSNNSSPSIPMLHAFYKQPSTGSLDLHFTQGFTYGLTITAPAKRVLFCAPQGHVVSLLPQKGPPGDKT